jgi:hypothetical protein
MSEILEVKISTLNSHFSVNALIPTQKEEKVPSVTQTEEQKPSEPLPEQDTTELIPEIPKQDKEEEDKIIHLIQQADEWRYVFIVVSRNNFTMLFYSLLNNVLSVSHNSTTSTTTDTGIVPVNASATVGSGRRKREDRPLPPGYICHRCTQPGILSFLSILP